MAFDRGFSNAGLGVVIDVVTASTDLFVESLSVWRIV